MEKRTLPISKKEMLCRERAACQAEDGTIYFVKDISSSWIFVKWTSMTERCSKLRYAIDSLEAHGNAVYFASDMAIYKATFSPSEGISVSFLRNSLQDEKFHKGAQCSQMRAGRKYVYRMWEDPVRDGIEVDISEEIIHSLEFKCVHRGKAIYLAEVEADLSVRQLGNNLIVVESPCASHQIYASDCSPLICILLLNKQINVLNTDIMRFMPPLMLQDVSLIWHITGIHNGEITVNGKIGDDFYSISAKLPDEYKRNSRAANLGVEPKRKECTSKLSDSVRLGAKKEEIVRNLKQVNSRSSVEMGKEIEFDSVDFILDQCCCSICSENFDSNRIIPRILDCGHTFCEKCLYNVKLRINRSVTCPNCKTITSLPDGKTLPKNFSMISLSDQLMKTRMEPKVACKSCYMKFSSSSVRMCNKEDCTMFNQLICFNCTIDGGHAEHAVKYDVKMEKIRKELRDQVSDICTQIKDKKNSVLDKTERLTELFEAIRKNLTEANIPNHVISQMDNIESEQEATEYKEIVRDLAKTIFDQCDTLTEAFDAALRSANGFTLLGEKAAAHVEEE